VLRIVGGVKRDTVSVSELFSQVDAFHRKSISINLRQNDWCYLNCYLNAVRYEKPKAKPPSCYSAKTGNQRVIESQSKRLTGTPLRRPVFVYRWNS
jgi:hypothetical protein